MFESIQDGISSAFRSLRGVGKLTEANMRDGLKHVERALLEADVSISAVRHFMNEVTDAATGERVLKSLDPTQQLYAIVYQQLVDLMGPVDHSLHLKSGVTVLMMCGLQGSGKTTTCGKLATLIKQNGRQPMMCAADLQRPAAIDQLHTLGTQIDVPVYSDRETKDPVKVCNDAVAAAKKAGADVLILDTAGRLHIDDELMSELKNIDRKCNPDQVYLVTDAMTGQDAVNSAKAFNEALELDGAIMTKLDGDARGGAALSVKFVTGVPIKFIGTGEHLDALEEFHPERMAGRILGEGDIVTLAQQAQQKLDQDEMVRQQELLEKGQFTLDDFKKQLQQITKLGPMQKVMGMLPGMGQLKEAMDGVDAEQDMKRMFGIIDSMTAKERRDPKKIIDTSRRRRIAAGAGVEPKEVSDLVKQFDAMASVMKEMAGMGMRERMRKVQELQQGGAFSPDGGLKKVKSGTGKRLTAKEKAKRKKEKEREQRRKRRQQRGIKT
ncbi:MAG: signal recognition particle protein [Pirellulales bacterium]|nr:signal recognition particle protein [Pirellulales bacterium]